MTGTKISSMDATSVPSNVKKNVCIAQVVFAFTAMTKDGC